MNREEFYEDDDAVRTLPTAYPSYGSDPMKGARLFTSSGRRGRQPVKLYVEWLNPATAEKEYQTPLSIDATIETLISATRKAGKFYIYGLDAQGERVTDEPTVITVAKDNALLSNLVTDAMPVPAMPGGATSVADVAMEMMREEVRAMREEMAAERARHRLEREAERERIEAERKALSDREEALAAERLNLTLSNTETVTNLHDKIITQQGDQALKSQDHITRVLSAQMDAAEKRHDMMMERLAADREHERKMAELTMKRMETEAKIRTTEEKSRRELEREENAARLERERMENDARMEREREYWANRFKEMEANGDDGPLALIEKYGPLASAMGVDLSKLGGLLTGSGGIVDAVAGAIGKAVDGFVEVKKLEIEKGVDEDDDPIIDVPLPDGRVIQMPQSQVEALQQQAMQQQAAMQGGMPGMPQPGMPPQQGGPMLPAPMDPNMQGGFNPHGQQPAPAYMQQPGFPQPGAPQQPAAYAPMEEEAVEVWEPPAAPIDPRAEQIREQLEPAVRKEVRGALRDAVEAIQGAPEDQWTALIMQMVQRTPTTIDYLRLRSIYDAVIEAGGSAGLALRLVSAIDASGLVPADIPRK